MQSREKRTRLDLEMQLKLELVDQRRFRRGVVCGTPSVADRSASVSALPGLSVSPLTVRPNVYRCSRGRSRHADQEPTLMLRLVVLVLKLLEPIHVIVQHGPVALR